MHLHWCLFALRLRRDLTPGPAGQGGELFGGQAHCPGQRGLGPGVGQGKQYQALAAAGGPGGADAPIEGSVGQFMVEAWGSGGRGRGRWALPSRRRWSVMALRMHTWA